MTRLSDKIAFWFMACAVVWIVVCIVIPFFDGQVAAVIGGR
jgi:hypothetical protein